MLVSVCACYFRFCHRNCVELFSVVRIFDCRLRGIQEHHEFIKYEGKTYPIKLAASVCMCLAASGVRWNHSIFTMFTYWREIGIFFFVASINCQLVLPCFRDPLHAEFAVIHPKLYQINIYITATAPMHDLTSLFCVVPLRPAAKLVKKLPKLFPQTFEMFYFVQPNRTDIAT